MAGQKIGYYVNKSKSWLILKDNSQPAKSKQVFQNGKNKFTCEGKRRLESST